MTQLFEGLAQARSFAETEAKKKNSERFVTKANDGGLVYKVYEKKEDIKVGEKVLARYDAKGLAVGNEPQKAAEKVEAAPAVENVAKVEPTAKTETPEPAKAEQAPTEVIPPASQKSETETKQ